MGHPRQERGRISARFWSACAAAPLWMGAWIVKWPTPTLGANGREIQSGAAAHALQKLARRSGLNDFRAALHPLSSTKSLVGDEVL